MLRFSRRQKAMIGLSVLAESIYLVQLRRVKNGYQVLHAIEGELPTPSAQTGDADTFVLLQQTLTAIVRGHQLQNCQAAICIPLSLVKMHSLVVPAGLAVRDVESEVYAEANRLLPVKNEKLAFDYQPLPGRSKEEKSVFFAATGETYLTDYARCLRAAGLIPAVIEIDVFSMLRAARYVLNHSGKSVKYAVLFVTSHYGLIAAHDGIELLFYKHWDIRPKTMHQITLMQWVEWCCQAYRHAGIACLGLGGTAEAMQSAVEVINQHWSCEVIKLNPFTNDAAALLACGLAMREPLSWLN